MRVIHARNVAEALPAGLDLLLTYGVREESRAGPALVAPWPVTTIYDKPQERVLFSAVRDANPFFHLAEACWMIAGRNDASFLNYFVKDFGDRFAERDGTIHGAYGHRWRHAFGIDQLDKVVEVLKKDPHSRQCVLQMWDANPIHGVILGAYGVGDVYSHDARVVGENLIAGHDDLRGSWRDRPCNTHAYLRVRDVAYQDPMVTDQNSAEWEAKIVHGSNLKLDLTVCCRSNDAVWGAYGANAVHFSVLQEYLAARIGIGIGTYYQISNNFHVYEAELERLRSRLSGETGHGWKAWLLASLRDDRYGTTRSDRHDTVDPIPLVTDPESFDREVIYLINAWETLGEGPTDAAISLGVGDLKNTFLGRTVWPALMAHRLRKSNPGQAAGWLASIEAPDWREACMDWLRRRVK